MISWDPKGQRKGSGLLWTLLDGSPALTQCAWPSGSWDNLRMLPKLRARRINSAGLSRQVLPWNQGAHFMGWRSEAETKQLRCRAFPKFPVLSTSFFSEASWYWRYLLTWQNFSSSSQRFQVLWVVWWSLVHFPHFPKSHKCVFYSWNTLDLPWAPLQTLVATDSLFSATLVHFTMGIETSLLSPLFFYILQSVLLFFCHLSPAEL